MKDILGKKAVAVQYKPEEAAPKVVASGRGYLAQKIIDTALESNVEIYHNSELVEELAKIDLGANIPPELYQIVAEILVFVSNVDKIAGGQTHG